MIIIFCLNSRSHLVAKDLFAILDEVNDELGGAGAIVCHTQAWPVSVSQPCPTAAVATNQGSWIVIRHSDLPFKIN